MESSGQENQCSAYKPLLLAVFLTLGLVQNANAYVDPNSAGPLFQMLFPLFVAVASTLSALRGMIKRAWKRIVDAFFLGACAKTNDDPH